MRFLRRDNALPATPNLRTEHGVQTCPRVNVRSVRHLVNRTIVDQTRTATRVNVRRHRLVATDNRLLDLLLVRTTRWQRKLDAVPKEGRWGLREKGLLFASVCGCARFLAGARTWGHAQHGLLSVVGGLGGVITRGERVY